MRLNFKEMLSAFSLTLLLFIFLEVASTTLLPLMGIDNYRLPFHVVFVIYLSFRLETPWLSLLIFLIQYFYSFFSIEGWAAGTFVGILVCMIIGSLKELIHFATKTMTIIITQLFQILWFLIFSLMVLSKTGDFDLVLEQFTVFLPGSIFVSLISPWLFDFLNKIWRVGLEGLLKEEV